MRREVGARIGYILTLTRPRRLVPKQIPLRTIFSLASIFPRRPALTCNQFLLLFPPAGHAYGGRRTTRWWTQNRGGSVAVLQSLIVKIG